MPLPSNAKIGDIIAKQQELTGINEKDALVWVLNEHGISANNTESVESLVQKARLLEKRNTLVGIANDIKTNNGAIKTDIVNKLKTFDPTFPREVTDTWGDIAAAILNMPKGKKFATGVATAPSTNTFYTSTNNTYTVPFITVSGLGFKPKGIIAYAPPSSTLADNQFAAYSEAPFSIYQRAYGLSSNNDCRWITGYNGTNGSATGYIFQDNRVTYCNETGFLMPVQSNKNWTWLAWE